MNPVLDSFDIDTFALIIVFLFFLALCSFFLSFLLESFKLLNLRRDLLICFLQVSLQFKHCLVLILNSLLKRLYVLIGPSLKFTEAFLTIFLLRFDLVSLLLHLGKLHLHSLQPRFLLHHGFLDIFFLLFLLSLLLGQLLLQNIHLLLMFSLDGLRLGGINRS